MDELDITNLFGAEFIPDAAEPTPTPPPCDDFPSPPPPLSDDAPKTWGKPADAEFSFHESLDLQTVNQLIAKFKNDPSYRIKSKKSKFHGYSVKDLKKFRDEIYREEREIKRRLRLVQRKPTRTPTSKSWKGEVL